MRKLLLSILPALLLLCLLWGCAKAPEKAAAAPPSPSAAEETAVRDTAPVTEAPPSPEETSSAQQAPRVFTEEDFHFYLGAEGAPEEGKINVAFYPDDRDASGAPDPDIRVWDSWLITDEAERREICERILACSLYDPALYGRTLESMLTEWQAHNDVNALYDNERTRHVDFNRSDEGVSYGEFWERAVRSFLGR